MDLEWREDTVGEDRYEVGKAKVVYYTYSIGPLLYEMAMCLCVEERDIIFLCSI